jgi:coniferyl-aldehyde dehydrogenase
MVPWHYPFNQALGPLVAALAAGNRVMILMSGLSPHSTVVLRQMLAQCFAPDEVAVFAGEAALTQSFLELPFDHLVFAGSSAAGRQVMRAAAEHLTPLTLTLGSKSPALLAPGAPLCAAAQSIAYGKAFNSAQGCMAPDYVLVAREQMLALVTELGLAFRHMYPQVSDNPDYTSVITDRHKARLCALLSDALLKGAQVVSCGEEDAGRRMPLQIVSGVRADMRIASEVVCGPLLPVIAYDSLEQALEWINARPRPLALYLYGFARAEWTRILRQTHSGGVAIDDCGWQGFNHDLPLGGIGDSGMGSYHGVEGFRALSHARAVFKRHPWFPMSGFHPPYGGWLQRLLLKFYLR